MGKAVLVISHDDRYFHLADRVIRMESGCLTFNGRPLLKDAAHATAAPPLVFDDMT
jgi:putative pyoverdin transport system ATP-binding/permease protein